MLSSCDGRKFWVCWLGCPKSASRERFTISNRPRKAVRDFVQNPNSGMNWPWILWEALKITWLGKSRDQWWNSELQWNPVIRRTNTIIYNESPLLLDRVENHDEIFRTQAKKWGRKKVGQKVSKKKTAPRIDIKVICFPGNDVGRTSEKVQWIH